MVVTCSEGTHVEWKRCKGKHRHPHKSDGVREDTNTYNLLKDIDNDEFDAGFIE
jgi:hypothetical protein